MRPAIITIFLKPTLYEGYRVRAKSGRHMTDVDWNDGISREMNHEQAAWKLSRQLAFNPLVKLQGGSVNNETMAWVPVITGVKNERL